MSIPALRCKCKSVWFHRLEMVAASEKNPQHRAREVHHIQCAKCRISYMWNFTLGRWDVVSSATYPGHDTLLEHYSRKRRTYAHAKDDDALP